MTVVRPRIMPIGLTVMPNWCRSIPRTVSCPVTLRVSSGRRSAVPHGEGDLGVVKALAVEAVADLVRARYGPKAVMPASLAGALW